MDARRIATHAGAAFAVGFVCTLGTAPFADDRPVAVAFFLCTPVLCALVGVFASFARSPLSAAGTAGALSVLAGMGNATAVWIVSQLLAGRTLGDEIGFVVLFSVPYGGVPGFLYSLPMAAAAFAARAATARDDAGALRPLAAVLGIVGIAALAVARTASHDYVLWSLVVRTGTAVAFACLAQAAVDLVGVLEVRRATSGRRADLAVVAPSGPGAWLVCRLGAHGDGPYRRADVAHPIRTLDRPPVAWIRARLAGAVGLAALAGGIGMLVA